MMNNNKNNYSIKRLLIVILMLIVVVIGGTFAWFTYQSKQSALVLTIGDINDIQITLKPYQVTGTMTPVTTYESGVYSEVEVSNNGSSSTSISLFYKINELDEELVDNGLKYTIVSSTTENGTYTEVKTGDFTSFKGQKEALIYEYETDGKSTIYYKVYLWVDSSQGDQSVIQGSTLDVELNGSILQEATAPEIVDGMIPVTISNIGVVTTISANDDNWYDYGHKKWANIVLVDNDSRSEYEGTTGKTVTQSDILAYYVWIPRFKYKLWTTNANETTNPQTINIIFEDKEDPMLLEAKKGLYRTHPAFWWDGNNDGKVDEGETLAGIWVGKFETTGDATTPTILPNVTSLRSQNVSTQFNTSLKFSNGGMDTTTGVVTFSDASNGVNLTGTTYGLAINADSHLMKNSEWGAAAYLSHSQYGINSEVRINNNSNFTTGCGASEENGSASDTCEIVYGGVSGGSYPQSTTGNITGIFDMSGGAYEYVMGVYSDLNGNPRSGNSSNLNSGFNGLVYDGTEYTLGISFPNSKYYDLYLSSQFTGDYSTYMSLCTLDSCGGHALSETASWYDDYADFVDSENPWFMRSGIYGDGSGAGVFLANDNGGGAGQASWRSVIITLPKYTVSYDANGGSSAPSSQIKVYGVDMTLSSTEPTKENSTFKGWGTSSDTKNVTYEPNGVYKDNRDQTLYAIWFDGVVPVGGLTLTNNVASSQTVTLTCSDSVGVTGYYFGIDQAPNDGEFETIESTPNMNITKTIDNSGTYYLYCRDAEGNVSEGVSKEVYKTTLIDPTDENNTETIITEKDSSFALPALTKEGYTVSSYNTASDGSGTSYQPGDSYNVVNDSTLYAQWTVNAYTVTYNSNNLFYGLDDIGTTVGHTMSYSIANKVVTVTASSDDGYGTTTGRVYLEANQEYTFSATSSGTWGTTSGTDTVEAFLMLDGAYNTIYHMKTNNYTFTPTVSGTYWLRLDVNQSGKTHTFSNIRMSYNVSTKDVTYNLAYGDLPTPTRTGYTFDGWYTEESGGTQVTSDTIMNVRSDHTLYAHWTPNTYQVCYDANGGSGAPSCQTTTYGTTLTLSSTKPTRTGYTFLGWSTSSTATSATYTAGGSYTDNVGTTLYAVWRLNKVSINFHVNGGTITESTGEYTWTTSNSLIYVNGNLHTMNINYGATNNLPNYNNTGFINVTRTGYSAPDGAEWICHSGCTTANKTYDHDVTYNATDFCDVAAGDCTVVVKVNWKINTYTVSYDANGGSGAPSSQTKTYGTTLTLSSTVPTRDGYTFLGWSTSSTATSATYAAGGSYTVNEVATLYAVWRANSYTLTLNGNGGNAILTEFNTVGETAYTTSYSGSYKLETWGGQGGSTSSYRGGYGGYSVGNVTLSAGTTLYVNVGGQGSSGYPNAERAGGYNGGGSVPAGSGTNTNRYVSGGGGATHIATASGLLSSLSSNTSSILIVAGGGGGGYQHTTSGYAAAGGNGGGYKGNNGAAGSSGGSYYGLGGSQTAAGTANGATSLGVGGFGYGGTVGSGAHGSAGGGGYYGGGGSAGYSGSANTSGGGGSGYIGNSSLTSKSMYCYSCSTSSDTSTLTYSTTNVSSAATSNYAKSGAGAARISSTVVTKTVTNNSTYGTLPTPTRSNYVFKGWNTAADGSGTTITSSSTVNLSANQTLYAIWDGNNLCTVNSTYENCLLNENKPSSLWTSTLSSDGYRFVGTNPNNYICFGTSDSSTCTSNSDLYMYRIIGIFSDSSGTKYLKLIKNTSIGAYGMDDNYNTNNNWSSTTLYSGINGSYFKTNTTYSYMQNSTWLGKIASWTWMSADSNLTAYNASGTAYKDLTPSQVYCYEMNLSCKTATDGTYVTNTAQIGLMYVSDYVLSTGSGAATTSSTTSAYAATLKTGWMYFGNHERTIARGGDAYSGITNARFYIIHSDGYPVDIANRYGYAVRPTFYIAASEKFAGGLGTAAKPFIIS